MSTGVAAFRMLWPVSFQKGILGHHDCPQVWLGGLGAVPELKGGSSVILVDLHLDWGVEMP